MSKLYVLDQAAELWRPDRSSAPPPPPPPPPPGTLQHGIYKSDSNWGAWETSMNTLDFIKVHVNNGSWAAWQTLPSVWANTSRRIMINLNPWPKAVAGVTLEQVRDGQHDSKHIVFRDQLLARGHHDALITFGHEFNGDFQPWRADIGRHLPFRDMFRHLVDLYRAGSGQQFEFILTFTKGNTMDDPMDAFPGAAYLGYLGYDLYDQDPQYKPSQGGAWATNRWDKFLTSGDGDGFGLNWFRQQGLNNGLPLTFPEWGLTDVNGANQNGGGDNTVYMTEFIDWVTTEDVRFIAYHESSFTDGTHEILGSNFPNSKAILQAAF